MVAHLKCPFKKKYLLVLKLLNRTNIIAKWLCYS